MSIDNNLKCNLCAGSPEIQRYRIKTKDKTIYTDICIGKEIEYLINNGVKTYACCCGHGDDRPSCLVSLNDKNKLQKLGYDIHEFTETHTKHGKGIIYLYTNIEWELRVVLQYKTYGYLTRKSNEIYKRRALK